MRFSCPPSYWKECLENVENEEKEMLKNNGYTEMIPYCIFFFNFIQIYIYISPAKDDYLFTGIIHLIYHNHV